MESLGYLYSNQPDKALASLEKAIDKGFLIDISVDNMFEPLWNDSRFAELVTKQQIKRDESLALVASYNFPEPEDF